MNQADLAGVLQTIAQQQTAIFQQQAALLQVHNETVHLQRLLVEHMLSNQAGAAAAIPAPVTEYSQLLQPPTGDVPSPSPAPARPTPVATETSAPLPPAANPSPTPVAAERLIAASTSADGPFCSQDAGNALGRGTQLQVVTDGQQDDVTREAMAGQRARRLAGRVAATGTAGAYRTSALIVTVAGQVRRRAVGAGRHRRSLLEPLNPTPTSQNPSRRSPLPPDGS